MSADPLRPLADATAEDRTEPAVASADETWRSLFGDDEDGGQQ